jgi:hypothetical protein
MNADTRGNYLTEQVDRRIAHPARVATFTEQRKREDIPEGVVEDKTGVAVEAKPISCEEK